MPSVNVDGLAWLTRKLLMITRDDWKRTYDGMSFIKIASAWNKPTNSLLLHLAKFAMFYVVSILLTRLIVFDRFCPCFYSWNMNKK